MKYQWLKDDEEPLSDGEDYKGTTTAELIIVGTGPQVKGNYKCLVKHKYGDALSSEFNYGMCVLLSIEAIFLTRIKLYSQIPLLLSLPLRE